MINLLAPEIKRELSAAKHNVLLRRYFLLVLSICLSMVAVFGVGYYLTWRDKQIADAERSEQIVKTGQFQSTRKAAAAYSANLATAKLILSKQTSASKFLTDLAGTVPKNVVLTQVMLTSAAPTATGTTFEARAKSFSDALALKESLEKSPLFENVSILSAQLQESVADASAVSKSYPLNVTISLVMSAKVGGTQ